MSHKTVITPKLYVTKTGKKYFLVDKKSVYQFKIKQMKQDKKEKKKEYWFHVK